MVFNSQVQARQIQRLLDFAFISMGALQLKTLWRNRQTHFLWYFLLCFLWSVPSLSSLYFLSMASLNHLPSFSKELSSLGLGKVVAAAKARKGKGLHLAFKFDSALESNASSNFLFPKSLKVFQCTFHLTSMGAFGLVKI